MGSPRENENCNNGSENMKQIKYWYLAGDCHANWRPLRNWVQNKLNTPKDKSAIIILGDVGINYFGGNRDAITKKEFNDIGVRLYCLRGNHEMRITEAYNYCNYHQCYDSDIGGIVWIEDKYPNLHFFKDEGGLYKIQNKNILVVPGAYSIDKFYRLAIGGQWFSDEQLSSSEQKYLFELASSYKIDYIFAHTCPYSWEHYLKDLFLDFIDQNAVDKTTEKFLQNLIYAPGGIEEYEHFYFGHFHDDRDLPDVKATMLYHKVIPLGCELSQQVDE